MRNILTRWAFAILKRYNASLWWDTVDVPGLFDPAIKGRITFRFDSMRFYLPVAARKTAGEVAGYNFVHTCPPECD